VQSYMDIENLPAVAGSQVGFLQFVALPIFESFSEYAPEASILVEHLVGNKSRWTELKDSTLGADVAAAEAGNRCLAIAPDGSLPSGGFVDRHGNGVSSTLQTKLEFDEENDITDDS